MSRVQDAGCALPDELRPVGPSGHERSADGEGSAPLSVAAGGRTGAWPRRRADPWSRAVLHCFRAACSSGGLPRPRRRAGRRAGEPSRSDVGRPRSRWVPVRAVVRSAAMPTWCRSPSPAVVQNRPSDMGSMRRGGTPTPRMHPQWLPVEARRTQRTPAAGAHGAVAVPCRRGMTTANCPGIRSSCCRERFHCFGTSAGNFPAELYTKRGIFRSTRRLLIRPHKIDAVEHFTSLRRLSCSCPNTSLAF